MQGKNKISQRKCSFMSRDIVILTFLSCSKNNGTLPALL
jgi:hypothetical protein